VSGFTTADLRLTRVDDWLSVGQWGKWFVWDTTDAPNIHQIGGAHETKAAAIAYAHYRINAEHGPSIDDLAKAERIERYDTALPVDWVRKTYGHDPIGEIVWSYDYDPIFGQPVAVTPRGHLILALVDLSEDGQIHDDTRARLQERIGAALKGMR